ncbi:MAG: DMT family transporter [Alphaproteobacteria bacterium]|nr:DMT family transporter [Alphaproteobacteria bacterium]OJV17259.1 MAG: hypothetical protein BGO27_06270 [Alphaproteobacteria bacterium 33-17]
MNNKILAVIFFLTSIFIGVCNDIITKYLGSNLDSLEVVFFRFLFATIILLPFAFKKNVSLSTSNPKIHLLRGFLLFGGIWIWSHSLSHINVATATVINFTIPIFTLILARLVLKEKVCKWRIIATFSGFIGVVIIANKPGNFDNIVLFVLFASFMFAVLDIVNKKYVVKESLIAMLLYSNLATLLFTIPFLIGDFVMPTEKQLVLLFILGAGANMLLYFLLKAFALADASYLVPFRYTEILIAGLMAYIFFGEKLHDNTIIGALFIIPSTLFISYRASKNKEV